MVSKIKDQQLNKGQSTVEYILLVTAVIAVVIVFLVGDGSLFQRRLNNVFEISTNSMENAATRFSQ